MKRPLALLARMSLVAAPVVALLLVHCSDLKSAPPSAEAGEGGEAGADLDAGPSDDAGDLPETGFTVLRHKPDAGALRAVSVIGTEQVYLGGDDGVLLEKAGAVFQQVVLGPGVDVTGVWASGPNEALAVATLKNTNKGPIFRRTSGVWTQIGTAPHGFRCVWGIGTMRYAGGNDGVIYSGPVNDPLRDAFQLPLPANVGDTLFAPIIWSITGTATNAVMAAADYDSTLLYDGTMWHLFEDPIDRTRSFRSVWSFAGPKPDFYQGANYFGLWHLTSDAGPTFQLDEEKDQPGNVNRWTWGVWGPSPGKIIAVGDGGRIMTYDQTSGKLTIQPSPTGKNLYAIGGTSLDDIWIVGEEQLVLHGHLSF